MAEHHPSTHQHDYLPAAGHDRFLPFYDLMSFAFGVRRVHRTLLAQAGIRDGHHVLEIGCGTGNLLRSARRPTIELVGLDPDPLALRRAHKKLPGVEIVQGYSQRMPFPAESFDIVLSSFMFHHLDPEAQTATASELRRTLRPRGAVHIADVVGHPHTFRHGATQGTFAHSHNDIPELLRSAGLDARMTSSRRHRFVGEVAYYAATKR